MTYAVSDLHGCYDRYAKLMESIRPEDTLYVLGDIVDRGPEGLRILLDMARRPNVTGILGNHDFSAAVCIPWLLQEINEETLEQFDEEKLQILNAWLNDGGDATVRELNSLPPERRQAVVPALMELSAWEEVEVGGRNFLLLHAGLENFRPDRPLEDYSLPELLCIRPDLERVYFPDRYLVYGHTPTRLQCGKDEVIRKNMQIAIDCGCVFGGKLARLCLDTLEAAYF